MPARAIQVAGTEEDTLRRCQRGEASAFEELYLSYHRGLYLFALSLLRDREAAEDLVQDIFVKLMGGIQAYRFHCPFSYWIYRVARNAAIDRMRREKRRRSLSLDFRNEGSPSLAERLPFRGPGPAEQAERAEQAGLLQAAVASLPESLRTPLLMCHASEMPYREISLCLGIPEGTVKSKIFRAKALLARKLSESPLP